MWERGNLSAFKYQLAPRNTPTKGAKRTVLYQRNICSHDCQLHHFSLQCQQGRILTRRQHDATASFCPVAILGNSRGGCPRFNHDRRSDTPSFTTPFRVCASSTQEHHSVEDDRLRISIRNAKESKENTEDENEELSTHGAIKG